MLGSGRWVHAFHTSGDDSDDSTSHIRAPDQQAFIAQVAVSTQGSQDLQVNARREDLVTGELDPSTGLEGLRIARVVSSTQGSQGLRVNPRRENAAKARSKRAELRRQQTELRRQQVEGGTWKRRPQGLHLPIGLTPSGRRSAPSWEAAVK